MFHFEIVSLLKPALFTWHADKVFCMSSASAKVFYTFTSM